MFILLKFKVLYLDLCHLCLFKTQYFQFNFVDLKSIVDYELAKGYHIYLCWFIVLIDHLTKQSYTLKDLQLSRGTTFPTRLHVCPAKIQISLCFRAV